MGGGGGGKKLTNFILFFSCRPISESEFFQVPPVMLGKNFNTPSATINLISINNVMPHFCAKFENHFNEQMVSFRKATIIERNIQGTSHNLLQKGKVFERHTR